MANGEAKARDVFDVLDMTAKILTPIVIFFVGTMYTCSRDTADRDQKASLSSTEQSQKARDRVITLTNSVVVGNPVQQKIALAFLILERRSYPDAVPEEIMGIVVPAVAQTGEQSRDAGVAEAAKEVAVAYSGNSALTAQVIQAVETVSQKIYFQIPDADRRAQADEIKRLMEFDLKSENSTYSIEGIENVGENRSPSGTEVRYFRDADRDSANNLAALLRKYRVRNVEVKPSALKARPFQLEVWFGKSSLPTPASRLGAL